MASSGGTGETGKNGSTLLETILGGGVVGQVIRYGITGGFVTGLQALTYWLLAEYGGFHPQLANFCGYLVAVVTGFFLHGRFSFAGHGDRSNPLAQAVRFIAVSLVSLALNAFWVWLCTGFFHWPTWSPIPFMGFVTPGLVFLLNRQWVFR